jgi:DNA adenine methylase
VSQAFVLSSEPFRTKPRRPLASAAALSAAPSPPPPAPRRPFIKWVGGKRQLLPELTRYVPGQFRSYFEPFVGGGALFFELAPKQAVLADANERLIRTYIGVRDSVEEVISMLRDYPHDEKFFYELREKDVDSGTDAEMAAWFIYLNKIGFNGLYRVNRQNRFNVPFGRHRNPNICDAPTLRACSAALAGTELLVSDFESVVEKAVAGDLVYFDPPYVPLSATSSFTLYTSDGFGADAQLRLRDVALRLKQRGVHVLLSNSSAGFVRELYHPDFEVREVSATRLVNSNGARRGAITELVIR